jgi:hypothetical protein
MVEKKKKKNEVKKEQTNKLQDVFIHYIAHQMK